MAVPITGGDQKPVLKYNAKSAKWKVDDVLLNGITMVVDVEHAEVGWMKLMEGQAPDFQMVPANGGVAFPPMPEDRDSAGKPLYRRGFRCVIKLPDKIAGGTPSIREWASNSLATCRSFSTLHDLWLAGKDANPGSVPIVKSTAVEEVRGQFGSNYAPVLVIDKWIPRPADLTGGVKMNGQSKPAAEARVENLEVPEDFAQWSDGGQGGDIPWTE